MKFTHYVFDWGDTLMVDFPDRTGPMHLWDRVAAVEGAKKTLAALHRRARCYLATNAQDSKEGDIVKALERVGLADYIEKVFCFQNVGCRKPSSEFFSAILDETGATPAETVMVGDNLDTDIVGAMAVGMQGIWYNPGGLEGSRENIRAIRSLSELISFK